ncbi:tryptophan synthase subunit alpha [Brachybacterium sp. EF45031]|uniref:tryptophan synthase subunit alpha n=1 Tax=Brachybacterium sillae TaxID=2810536 RepID=UPI00217ED20E|nr:tryptophan synthase subunit alpha [Brachybacterium sillae]MCS6710561.1 tryptophan synthase subunit alpha [Brachybacterium sillae]
MSATGPRAAQILDRTRDEGRPALIGYLPAGFPDVRRCIDAAKVLVDEGVDILEIGLPYSDPVMDGPVIQAATEQSLAQGFRTRQVFDILEALADTGAALLVMTYWNLVEAQGVEDFARRLADSGGAGLITPDLIPEEAGEWIAASDAHDLDRVFLVAPSSPRERLEHVVRHSRGFVYAASTMGVTGTRSSVSSAAEGLVERTRAAGAPHVAVGLGVSTADQAAEVGAYADGVIVGSAFVRALADGNGDTADLARTARDLRSGIDRARGR